MQQPTRTVEKVRRRSRTKLKQELRCTATLKPKTVNMQGHKTHQEEPLGSLKPRQMTPNNHLPVWIPENKGPDPTFIYEMTKGY